MIQQAITLLSTILSYCIIGIGFLSLAAAIVWAITYGIEWYAKQFFIWEHFVKYLWDKRVERNEKKNHKTTSNE